jgi:aryl-alcohol dehydrogenase-like predicted oxidoreductase
MEYRSLGKSGLRVSEAALGTMTFGASGDGDHRRLKRRKSLRPTAKQAENFIETANFYTNGTSERFLGDFIQRDRQGVVLATK